MEILIEKYMEKFTAPVISSKVYKVDESLDTEFTLTDEYIRIRGRNSGTEIDDDEKVGKKTTYNYDIKVKKAAVLSCERYYSNQYEKHCVCITIIEYGAFNVVTLGIEEAKVLWNRFDTWIFGNK